MASSMSKSFSAVKRSKTLVLVIAFICGFSNAAITQEDSPWWKGLFDQKSKSCDSSKSSPGAPPERVPDIVYPIPAATEGVEEAWAGFDELVLANSKPMQNRKEGHYNLVWDERMAELDSTWKTLGHPVQGYRVQLFSGSLQAAREFRSLARKSGKYPVYLSAMPPNYRITLGDFRTKWEAENVKDEWLAAFPLSLVIPMAIELPALPEPQD